MVRTTSAVDGQPYGARVPLLAVGRFARQNLVSHTSMEHSSIVKFVEWNWLGATGQLQTRDAAVNSIDGLSWDRGGSRGHARQHAGRVHYPIWLACYAHFKNRIASTAGMMRSSNSLG